MYRRDTANDRENLYTAGASDKNGDCLRNLDQRSKAAQEEREQGVRNQSMNWYCLTCGWILKSGSPVELLPQSSEGPTKPHT